VTKTYNHICVIYSVTKLSENYTVSFRENSTWFEKVRLSSYKIHTGHQYVLKIDFCVSKRTQICFTDKFELNHLLHDICGILIHILY